MRVVALVEPEVELKPVHGDGDCSVAVAATGPWGPWVPGPLELPADLEHAAVSVSAIPQFGNLSEKPNLGI
jgi:hypothetical protein